MTLDKFGRALASEQEGILQSSSENVINCLNKRLTHVSEALDSHDVIIKKQLDERLNNLEKSMMSWVEDNYKKSIMLWVADNWKTIKTTTLTSPTTLTTTTSSGGDRGGGDPVITTMVTSSSSSTSPSISVSFTPKASDKKQKHPKSGSDTTAIPSTDRTESIAKQPVGSAATATSSTVRTETTVKQPVTSSTTPSSSSSAKIAKRPKL